MGRWTEALEITALRLNPTIGLSRLLEERRRRRTSRPTAPGEARPRIGSVR